MSRASEEVEVPPGERLVAVDMMWMTGPSGPDSQALAMSLSGRLSTGELISVAAGCGPGETVVALEDGSVDVWRPRMRATWLAACSPRLVCGSKAGDDGPSSEESGRTSMPSACCDVVSAW